MTRAFRLQSLLDYRRQLEEERTRMLAEATQAESEARLALDARRSERDAQAQAIADGALAGSFDAPTYVQSLAYLDALDLSIRRQVEVLAAARTRVSADRERLVEVLKEKQSLERLRDRQAAEAALEDGRREARDVDDLNTGRYVRRAL